MRMSPALVALSFLVQSSARRLTLAGSAPIQSLWDTGGRLNFFWGRQTVFAIAPVIERQPDVGGLW